MSSSYFSYTKLKRPKRSVFDLSYENKLSFSMGQLIPVTRYDVIPGDKFKSTANVTIRLAPLIAPVMHRIDAYIHYFFVPYRLVYDDWKDFITGGTDGLADPVFPRATIPAINSITGATGVGSLADYLGLNFPSMSYPNNYVLQASLLPFRAYQLIYNEYYRDQNLTPEVGISKASGSATTAIDPVFSDGTDYDPTTNAAATELFKIRYRAWEKDYFTSALPFPQRGFESVVPVDLSSQNGLATAGASLTVAVNKSTGELLNIPTTQRLGGTSNGNLILRNSDDSSGSTFNISGEPRNSAGYHYHTISANDLKDNISASFSIAMLRTANAVQRFLERMNIGGSRYIEQIYSMFGVQVPDYTLQRPQYIGGGKLPIAIGDVMQTSATDISGSSTPQANMAGYAFANSNSPEFKKTFDEHGIVLGIMSVRPRSSYMQGLDRMYTKFDRYDYYWPQFAHLGEQTVKASEVFMSGNMALDTRDFGYQERYAEYKFRNSEVHGDFKDSLDYWHLGRKFANSPSLNTAFIECHPDTRIYAVESDSVDKVYAQVINNTTAVRPIPKHVTPSL